MLTLGEEAPQSVAEVNLNVLSMLVHNVKWRNSLCYLRCILLLLSTPHGCLSVSARRFANTRFFILTKILKQLITAWRIKILYDSVHETFPW